MIYIYKKKSFSLSFPPPPQDTTLNPTGYFAIEKPQQQDSPKVRLGPQKASRVRSSRLRMVVVFVVTVVGSVALRQYLVLHGVEVHPRAADVFLEPGVEEAEDLLEGPPHVAVSEGVDDGVDQGVALGQHQAVLLVAQHLALLAAQAVQQQHHQGGRPAEHEAAWERRGEQGRGRTPALQVQRRSPITSSTADNQHADNKSGSC